MACRREPTWRDRLRIVTLQDWYRAVRERFPVSIQIVDAANPAARQEVRERLANLMTSACECFGRSDEHGNELPELRQKLREEVKSLYFALTGSQLTDEELKPIVYDDKESGSEN